MSFAWVWIIGLLFGVRHAVDADHLSTLNTILKVQGTLRGALRTTLLWSLGHTCTFLCVGMGLVAFGLHLPPMFEVGAKLAVAMLLIGLGLAHLVQPAASMALSPRVAAALTAQHGLRPLAAGLVHGLAATAGIALIAVTAIPDTLGALLYLAAFAVGTVAGMGAVMLLLASPWQLPQNERAAGRSRVRRISALAAMACVGLGASLAFTVLDRSPRAVARWHAGPAAARSPT